MTNFDRDKLVNWFIKNFSDYYLDMMKSQHYVDPLQPNIFHAEGSVWTHTMMVVTWIEAFYKPKLNYEDYIVLLTTGMLHDLGKPSCEELQEANHEKPIRNSFKGHEGVSVHLGIAVLKALKQDFPTVYTDEVIELIIKLVGTHGVAIDNSDLDPRFTTLRTFFRECDKRGAIRMVDEGLFSQYEARKYSPVQKNAVKELIIVTGQPCSGKSTLIQEKYPDYTVVSRDSFLMKYSTEVLGLTGSYNEIYKELKKNDEYSKEVDREFEKELTNIAKNSSKVVIDMTMMPLSSRRKMCNKFPNFKRKSIVMLSDMDTINKRNEERAKLGKYISPKTFLSMQQSFVYPVLDEGFESIELIIN